MGDEITPETIKRLFRYDQYTGALYWEASTNRRIRKGARAGVANQCGRWYVGVRGQQLVLARVVWCWMTGAWPDMEIDHVDGDCGNDRWANLRQATSSENKHNRRVRSDSHCQLKGVARTRHGNWVARIQARGVHYWLGTFDSSCDAHEAYKIAAKRLHGRFARV